VGILKNKMIKLSILTKSRTYLTYVMQAPVAGCQWMSEMRARRTKIFWWSEQFVVDICRLSWRWLGCLCCWLSNGWLCIVVVSFVLYKNVFLSEVLCLEAKLLVPPSLLLLWSSMWSPLSICVVWVSCVKRLFCQLKHVLQFQFAYTK